jgi:hypothetical protein
MVMSKNKIYLLGTGVILVIGLLALFFLSRGAPNSSSNQAANSPLGPAPANSVNNLPSYVLQQDEETRVREFAVTFVNLYNTYSYQDTGTILSFGDYETEGMQNKSIDYAKQLDDTLQPGDKVDTVADPDSFSYDYPQFDTLIVHIRATATQVRNNIQLAPYPIAVELDFKKADNQKWYVDGVTITKP